MEADSRKTISRRTFLAGLIPAGTLGPGRYAIGRQVPEQSLSNGLTIVDYRLFPTQDALRFIAEVRNDTASPVDTPTVGLVLPHLDPKENFAWANPVSMVLHPHSSSCLIGIAPKALSSNDHWGEPEWMLCDEIKTNFSNKLPHSSIEISHSIELSDETDALITIDITNRRADESTGRFHLQGIIRDADGRICGALPTWTIPWAIRELGPNEHIEDAIALHPGRQYHASPFPLLDTLVGIEVNFTVQAHIPVVNSGCSPVMPWNRPGE